LNEGFGDGFYQRALEKLLKKLKRNGNMDELFELYEVAPDDMYVSFDSDRFDMAGFRFNFQGKIYAITQTGAIYGFSTDHLSSEKINDFFNLAKKISVQIENTIKNV
jgi:hypothetical protein